MFGQHDTITVWNKTVENGKTVYYRHVVPRCYWRSQVIRNVSGSTVSLGTAWNVTIEAQDGYMPYSEWMKLADKSAFFTFNVGDIVARGKHADEMTADNAPALYNQLKPDVFTIKTVTDNTQEWKHGRHIAVEGV